MIQDFDSIIIGGGAAGYFAALRVAALAPQTRVLILEAGKRPLDKVRVSGGGRCNVTHNCFDPKNLVENYPRGSRELRGPFSRFQPKDTVAWFAQRNIELKTEPDGRMFPVTDNSSTIIDCLESERQRLGVELFESCRVKSIKLEADKFLVDTDKTQFIAKKVLLATGSNKSGYEFAKALGHSITPLVPSLFTFNVSDKNLHQLSGISVSNVKLALHIKEKLVKEFAGPLLITHWGLSGPAVLKLSAFAAQELHEADYKAELIVNFAGSISESDLYQQLLETKKSSPKKLASTHPPIQIPSRLWDYLLQNKIKDQLEVPWAELPNSSIKNLAKQLTSCPFAITGKGQFKDEFVTCGGVELAEVDFRTMQSKIRPGLYLAGEILDIDGITGGFNFQSAWTTGWLAGTAMSEA